MRTLLSVISLLAVLNVYSQTIELDFPVDSTREIRTFFTPYFKTTYNSTRFFITLDSVQSYREDYVWDVSFIIHIKTDLNEIYSRHSFLFPISNSWDTILQGKVITYDIQPLAIKPSDTLVAIVRQVESLTRSVESFPQCKSDSELQQVNEAFRRLGELGRDSVSWGKLRQWLAKRYVALGRLLLEKDCAEAAVLMFDKALEMNRLNSDAALFLADFYIKSGQFDLAYDYLNQSITATYAATYGIAGQLAADVFDFYLEKAKSTGDLNRAMLYAGYADTLTSQFGVDRKDLDTVIFRLVEDYFNRLNTFKPVTDKGDDSLLRGFLTLFEFCHKYGELEFAGYFGEKVCALGQRVMSSLNSLAERGRYPVATYYAHKILKLCSSEHNRFKETPDICSLCGLDSKVAAFLYKTSLERAKRLIDSGQVYPAAVLLDSLKILGHRYNLDTSVWSTLKNRVEQRIFDVRLDSVYSLSDSGFYVLALSGVRDLQAGDSAGTFSDTLRKVYDRVVRSMIEENLKSVRSSGDLPKLDWLLLKYGMYDDPQIKAKYDTLLRRYLTNECAELHYGFFRVFRVADTLVKRKKFLDARDSMEYFAKKAAHCSINLDTIERFIVFYRKPILYQKLTDTFYFRLAMGDYDKAFKTLLRLGEFYYSQNIAAYGIEPPDFYTKITNQDPAFVKYCARGFVHYDSLDLALKLLEFLRTNNIKAADTRQIQELLGYKLALRDFSLSPYQKPLEKLSSYIKSGRMWYRYLTVAYIKQRRKMKVFKL